MADINFIPFDPSMDKEEILKILSNYAKQNPAKWALKKEALLKKYGLNINDELVEEVASEDQKELEEIKKKIVKKK